MEDRSNVVECDLNIAYDDVYREDVFEQFSYVPDVAKPLLCNAKLNFEKIESMLYSLPGIINMVKASFPEIMLDVVLTDEQKVKMANGSLKLMTKKDGSLMANLIDPSNHKIVSTISLKEINVSPEISQAITSFTTQMQMAQLAEQIQEVQIAIEEVRQGQENDRLAIAYSCQQKLLQALELKNQELKSIALLRIVADGEDCRNQLMLSQRSNLEFIKEQPENLVGKIIGGANTDKINARMEEIRESLCVVNMVSFVEAMAYQEIGELGAAKKSLCYYSDFITHTYLAKEGLVKRLDLIDQSPKNYWSTNLPNIQSSINQLTYEGDLEQIGEKEDER